MTKSDLIGAVAARANMTHISAENVVNLIFKVMADALLRGERIELRGFASFDVKAYDGYTGRNPKTGRAIEVKAKRLPVFKAGKELQRRLNSRSAEQSGREEVI